MRTPGVWVFLESYHGRLVKASFEAAAASVSLAATLQGSVSGIFADKGRVAEADCATLAEMGIERILYLRDAEKYPDPELSILWTLKYLWESRNPGMCVFGATDRALCLAPQLALVVGAGCISEATYVRVVGGRVHVTRPILGGKLAEIVRFASESGGVVRTSSKAFEVSFLPGTGSHKVPDCEELICCSPPYSRPEQKVVAYKREDANTLDLEDASIVVAGGRGLGSQENFRLLEGLAEALGGTVAASRVAVDLRWASKEKLVGQTGRKISPELYIACGISGASQHVVGIKGARTIVAINTDPHAPIYRYATWGILGDAATCVSLLTRMVRAYREGRVDMADR